MEGLLIVLLFVGFFWLMGVLFLDYGPIVIVLFVSAVGNLILAVLTLLSIQRTWKPLLLCFGTVFLGSLFYG